MGQDRGGAACGGARDSALRHCRSRFIARHEQLLQEVESVVRDLVCEDAAEDYVLTWRVYGVNGVRMTSVTQNIPLGEAFILGECIAPTRARAAEVIRTTKQY